MSEEDLRWRIEQRTAGNEYKIFRTAFVDASHPRIGTKRFSLIECGDWVNIIALTEDQQVVLVRQYRVGTDEVCLEIPGGMVDPGEDAATAAARELEEETGYTARAWRAIGKVAPNPAIQNNYLHTYLATGARRTQEQRLDGSEVLTVATLPLAEVQAALRAGTIDHALVVAAFAHLALETCELRAP
jgi:8-oxo-dGTP pyrophosphatase MutT (NUDIX family)